MGQDGLQHGMRGVAVAGVGVPGPAVLEGSAHILIAHVLHLRVVHACVSVCKYKVVRLRGCTCMCVCVSV